MVIYFIKSTNQDRNIIWKCISNEPNEDKYQSEATEIHNYNIKNKKSSTTKYSTKHNF